MSETKRLKKYVQILKNNFEQLDTSTGRLKSLIRQNVLESFDCIAEKLNCEDNESGMVDLTRHFNYNFSMFSRLLSYLHD